MSGMTAIKILKMPRERITRQAMVKAKLNTMVIPENKDAPKEVAVSHEHPLVAAVVVKLDTHLIVNVLNIIASMRRRVNKKRKSKLQVQKF